MSSRSKPTRKPKLSKEYGCPNTRPDRKNKARAHNIISLPLKVFTRCESCKTELTFKSSANTRIEMAMKEGDLLPLSCNQCGHKGKYHLNKISARQSNSARIIAGLIFLIGTLVAIYMMVWVLDSTRNHYLILAIGGILFAPVFAYITITKEDEKRVSSFNRLKIKSPNNK